MAKSRIYYNVDYNLSLEKLLNDDPDRDVIHYVSNENIRPAEKVLAGLSGLGGYIGVASPTVNFYILSKLQKNNTLDQISLVDINYVAIKRMINMIDKYNSLDDQAYAEYLRYQYSKDLNRITRIYYPDDDAYREFMETNVRKSHLKYDVNVDILNSNIFDFLRSLSRKGRYFIYFSNVFDYVNSGIAPDVLKSAVVYNKNIEDDSVVLFTSLIWKGKKFMNELIGGGRSTIMDEPEAASRYEFGVFKKSAGNLEKLFAHSS